MAPTTMDVDTGALPAPNPSVGTPAALDSARDLVAERNAEASANRNEASKKAPRFQARKLTIPDRPPASSAPEYENYMFEAAANNPFASLKMPAPSTYVPNTQVCFFILNHMDHLMAGTKRWLDNCVGWNPLISQLYISVLIYYQIIRAMDAASLLGPGSELTTFLVQFASIFPLADLWIPGPLVSFFRNLSAFWPTESDRFGNVCPVIPNTPGWNQNTLYKFGDYHASHHVNTLLPNISYIIDRIHAVCTTALAAANQAAFNTAIDGPLLFGTRFGGNVNNAAAEQHIANGPAAKWILPDNLNMWKSSASYLNYLNIPAALNAPNNDQVNDSWIDFLAFNNNQHVYFGNIASTMAKYCQFFQGSKPISEIMPNCSAAGAIKLRSIAGSNLIDPPPYTAAVVNPAAAARRTLRSTGRVIHNARSAIEDVPTAHVYAATTFGYNSYWDAATQNIMRRGPFWTLGPDTDGRDNIEVLPGLQSIIVRKYHSDVRIPADKQ